MSYQDLIHPDYRAKSLYWTEWRETFEGGVNYLDTHLKRFSDRETEAQFIDRKSCTPIPSFAKAAILDIRNSIFQRLTSVTRVGGSKNYQSAANGERQGVDLAGSTMNSFIGIDVLTELLIMGKVGIFVDSSSEQPTVGLDSRPPYIYLYRVEDIQNWVVGIDGKLSSVLLRDREDQVDADTGFPKGQVTTFRRIWKQGGQVLAHFQTSEGDTGPTHVLEGLTEIPFMIATIEDSLLTDVASYQRSLLNLVSTDVNWAIRSNIPFLTIQKDMRAKGDHLKKHGDSASSGDQPARDNDVTVGGSGYFYEPNQDRPAFISPSSDPLRVSMALQEKQEDDIRKLINLAVSNKIGSRTESAEAKKLSSQGLEAGLSYIGMVLEKTEQFIANTWATYEDTKSPKTALVKYPLRYILKPDSDRMEDAKDLLEVAAKLPGMRVKKEITKKAVLALLGGTVTAQDMEKFFRDIDSAEYTSSDLNIINSALDQGLLSDETASEALGFSNQVEQARKDRSQKIAATLAAQTPKEDQSSEEKPETNLAARGAGVLDPQGARNAAKEKE